MRPQDDVERQLTRFGEKLREESDLAERVGTRLESAAQPISNGSSSWLGGLTMRQRITLGGLSVTAAVCLAAFLISCLPAEPVLAQAAEKIREAKSYSFESIMKPTKPGFGGTTRQRFYWQAPGACRMELFTTEGDEPDDLTIVFTDKPGIRINHQAKAYWREPARRGKVPPLLVMMQQLGRFTGSANRELGRKEIGGTMAEGFEIDVAKIDPDASGSMELWIDVTTKLPVLIRLQPGKIPVVMQTENFKWNGELPPKLFDTTPPDGYTDKTQPEKDIPAQVAEITAALKLYAELSGGHYPKMKTVYGDMTRDEMFGMVGMEIPPTVEQQKNPRYLEIQMATFGLARICVIQRENPDAAFHGINVGPKDADKVLFRWKLSDGGYQVIYGDLRNEAISAQRLKEIE